MRVTETKTENQIAYAKIFNRTKHPERRQDEPQGTPRSFGEVLSRSESARAADSVGSELRDRQQIVLRLHRAKSGTDPRARRSFGFPRGFNPSGEDNH